MGRGRSADKVRARRARGKKPPEGGKPADPSSRVGASSAASSSPAPEAGTAETQARGIVRRGPHPSAATSPVAVRVATNSDAEALGVLWLELAQIQATLGEEWTPAEGAAERFSRQVASALTNPRTTFLVAEMETRQGWKVVGFLHAGVKLRSSLYLESVVGEIRAISVTQDVCGRGIGAALLAAAMDWFRKRGLTHVEVETAAGNLHARGFLRASGFRESASVLWAPVEPAPAGAAATPEAATSPEAGSPEPSAPPGPGPSGAPPPGDPREAP